MPSLLLPLWLCTLALLPSPLKAECPVTATGLCTPGVEETIVEDIVETTEYQADGYTVTTETTTTAISSIKRITAGTRKTSAPFQFS